MFSLFSSARRTRPLNPHQPNLLEVTGTTLPLLSTVLAGFSVTAIVELLTQAEADQAWSLLNISLTSLAIAVSFFLSSTIFSVWGQSHNYLILTPEIKQLMNVNITDDAQWKKFLDQSQTIWQKWHTASVILYVIGLVAFVLGIELLLWQYISEVAAISVLGIFLLITVFGLILVSVSEKVRKTP